MHAYGACGTNDIFSKKNGQPLSLTMVLRRMIASPMMFILVVMDNGLLTVKRKYLQCRAQLLLGAAREGAEATGAHCLYFFSSKPSLYDASKVIMCVWSLQQYARQHCVKLQRQLTHIPADLMLDQEVKTAAGERSFRHKTERHGVLTSSAQEARQ